MKTKIDLKLDNAMDRILGFNQFVRVFFKAFFGLKIAKTPRSGEIF